MSSTSVAAAYHGSPSLFQSWRPGYVRLGGGDMVVLFSRSLRRHNPDQVLRVVALPACVRRAGDISAS